MANLAPTHILGRYLAQVLRPFVRLALRHGLRMPDVLETMRSVFVKIAQEEITRLGAKPSVSRLAVTTGMNRRDVQRYSSGATGPEITLALPTRVISLWLTHERFANKQGKPRILSFEGPESEFHALVQMVSTDVHPASVLFELERVHAVERTPRGIQLVMEGYMPNDPEQGIRMLSEDLEQLLLAVDENIFAVNADKNLHVRTISSRIAAQDFPTIRDWLLREGGAFHRRVRDFLADYDLELNPKSDRKVDGEVIVTTFGRVFPTKTTQRNN